MFDKKVLYGRLKAMTNIFTQTQQMMQMMMQGMQMMMPGSRFCLSFVQM